MSADALGAWLAFGIGFGVPGYGEEGAESNDPSDPGHFTWRGITLNAFRAWRSEPNATPTQLVQMPEAEFPAFYGCSYFNSIAGNQLPDALAFAVMDFAVNAGPRQAAITLQERLGFSGNNVDGSIGPHTLTAVSAAPNLSFLVGQYTTARIGFYQSLTTLFPIYGQGWTGRANRCDAAATALLPVPASSAVVNFKAHLRALGAQGGGAKRAYHIAA